MEYLIKFSAVLGLFYVLYKLFLEKETFFNAIRGFLLLGILSALVIPLISVTEYVYVEGVFVGQNSNAAISSTPSTSLLDFNLSTVLLFGYTLGVVFFGVRFLLQLGSLVKFILSYPKKRQNGFVYIEADDTVRPYSFFHFIVFPKKGFNQQELKQIIAHEKVHALHFHSIDMLLSQLLIIFNWFNPLAWLYHREIQKNLEFIADQVAQVDHKTKQAYQYLLLKTIASHHSLTLTSNFYNSLIKKRINMLHKNKSGKLMYFKLLLVIPLLIAFVFTFNTKVIAQQKKVETVEITTELEVQIITKDFQKSDLEALQNKLMKKGITFDYKKLKYNDQNEITGIRITVSNKQNNKTQIEQSGTTPIKPISIKFDDNGALAVGNIEGMEEQNVFVTASGSGNETRVFINDKGKAHESTGKNMVWVSEDGVTTKVKVVDGETVTVEKSGDTDENVWVTKSWGDSGADVWVSESGDSTKLKTIKIIEIDEASDGAETVFLKKVVVDEDGENVTVRISGVDDENEEEFGFVSKNEKPLFIVDGVEKPDMEMDDISPDDIEKVEVFKGDKATEKYGDKAKDGVVLITTKK